MELTQYQREAAETDLHSSPDEKGLRIALLGLAGETGSLLTDFKKVWRDENSEEWFASRAEEELGDILWYLSTIATHAKLDLATIAAKNLSKTQGRWHLAGIDSKGISERYAKSALYDDGFPPKEQLPREITIKIKLVEGRAQMRNIADGSLIGNPLSDNAHDMDGYKFHDVLHLSNMAMLGWSPVMRKLLDCKRKSDPKVDEVEDGARAAVLEECIVALAFDDAEPLEMYEGVRRIDGAVLAAIRGMVRRREVKSASASLWEKTLLTGFGLYRRMVANDGGIVKLDLRQRSIEWINE